METLPQQPTLREIRDHAKYWNDLGIEFAVIVRNWIEAEKGQLKLEIKFHNIPAQKHSEDVGKFVYAYRDTLINLIMFGSDDESLSRLEFVKSLYDSCKISDSLARRRRKAVKDVVAVG